MQPGRVLVVDDDRETRESTVAILTGWGWTVDAIADLPDDLAGGIERPALVIADYELAPGRTGLDVLAAIRAAHGDLPALLISGNSSVELQDRAQEAGLILLQKPVRPVQLRSAVLGVMG
jgi:CheY-like chemotaxis protein